MSDAEKERRGEMLREAEAIEVGKEVITSTPEMSARKAAEKWWDDNVGEPALYETEAGEVEINRNSVESSLAHRYSQMKLDAITSLVDGFENAVYLGTMPDSRERGVLDHYFAYPIIYDGKRCYVFCRAMQDANKNRLYVHEVFVADKIKKGNTLQTAASKPHGGIALYRDILANVLDVQSASEVQNGNSAIAGSGSQSEPKTENGSISNGTPPKQSEGKGSEKSASEQGKSEKNAEDEQPEQPKSNDTTDALTKAQKDAAEFPYMGRMGTRYTASAIRTDAEGKRYTVQFEGETDANGNSRERRINLNETIPEGATMVIFSPNGVIPMGYASRNEATGKYTVWDNNGKLLIKDGERKRITGGKVDSQGNPLNNDGTLKVVKIKSVNELADDDFDAPTRSVQLPKLPQKVDDAIGANGKPVIIKKNIFEKNKKDHPEVTAEQSREILQSALFNPDIYGQNQKTTRPYNWVLIRLKDKANENKLVLLEVNHNKDSIEVVHWHYVRDKSLDSIKRQAEREGGLLLMLPSHEREEAGGLSGRTPDKSSVGKDSKKDEEKQEAADTFLTKENSSGVQGKLGVKLYEGVDYSGEVTVDGKTTGVGVYYDMEALPTEEPVGFFIVGKGYNNPEWKATETAFWKFVKERGIEGAYLDDEGGPTFSKLRDAMDFKDYLEAMDKPNPVGKGPFGNIYDQFKGKAKEAIKFLMGKKEGEAVGALHHHKVGDISLVWGDSEAGLKKILAKHPEVVNNLQDIIDGMEIVSESDNRIKLESPTHFAVISKEYKGKPRDKWLLTAYEKKGSGASDGSMGIGSEPKGKQNGTAPLQNPSSTGKGNNSSAPAKGKGKKNELQAQRTDAPKSATKEQIAIRDGMAEHLNRTGLQTFADEQLGQRIVDNEEQRIREKRAASQENTGIQFFRSSAGEILGFTVGGKIYLDPRKATPETAFHEYGHIWLEALKQGNRKEYDSLMQKVKDDAKLTPIWEEVKKNYPGLSDEALTEEVFVMYSGRKGSRRIEERIRQIAAQRGMYITQKATTISALQQLKQAIQNAWRGILDFLHINYKNVDEAVEQQVKDFIMGNNPLDALARHQGRYTAEEQSIIDNAKRNGTYMKAPNGKKSKLTPFQWVQTRTKAFKQWFGDWELAHKRVKVADATEMHFANNTEFLNYAKRKFKEDSKDPNKKGERVWKSYTNKDTGNEIQLSSTGISKSMSNKAVEKSGVNHATHLRALGKLDEIIENSILGETHPDKKGSTDIIEIQRYYGAVNIDGHIYRVKTTVKKVNKGKKGVSNQQYSFEVQEMELMEERLARQEIGDTKGANNPTTPNNSITGAKLLENVKNSKGEPLNSSKIVDENGEPLVVWRGADYDPLSQPKGKGVIKPQSYFSPSRAYAEIYARNGETRAYWLDVRHPFDVRNEKDAAILNSMLPEGYKFAVGKSGALDWAELSSLDIEDLMEAHPEYDGIILDEGADYDAKGNAVSRGLSVMPFHGKGQVKSATDNEGTFDREHPDIRFQFAGEKGARNLDTAEERTERMDNLSIAREMEAAKKDAKAIKLATGWERGADGLWRYEIPDAQYTGLTPRRRYEQLLEARKRLTPEQLKKLERYENLNTTPEQQREYEKYVEQLGLDKLGYWDDTMLQEGHGQFKLTEMLSGKGAEQLFKAYPELRNINVSFEPLDNGTYANYNDRDHTITLNSRYFADGFEHGSDLRTTLLHEIQHVIQYVEGFTKGGNPKTVRDNIQKEIDRIADKTGANRVMLEGLHNTNAALTDIDMAKDWLQRPDRFLKDMTHFQYSGTKEEIIEKGQKIALDRLSSAFETAYKCYSYLKNDLNDKGRKIASELHDSAKILNDVNEGTEAVTSQNVYDAIVKVLKGYQKYIKGNIRDIAGEKSNKAALETITAPIKREDRLREILNQPLSGNELYHRLGGEVEARNVERRNDMTEEERRQTLAKETEDVAPEDQIFLRGEGDNAERQAATAESRTREEDVEEVNRRFNERLSELVANPNQKDKVLHLGHPATFLRAGGVADGEIILEFDKFVRKSGENYKYNHPFDAKDIENLPIAINSPIAVFNSTDGKASDKVILTELKKDGRDFVVVLRAREENRNGGVVLTVNRITTLYPKDARGVINWFNNGLATNIDKEKAGQWITALQTHLGTDITKAELNSAAKVVQNFETPKIEAENKTETSDIIAREGEERTQATETTDPVETFLSRKGGSRSQAPTKEQQEQMKGAAESAAKALNLGNVRIITTPKADDPNSGLKAYYDKATGQIVIYAGNHVDNADIVQSVLHEGVAHYGLRQLLGDKFDTFLDEVYAAATPEIRKRVDHIRQRDGYSSQHDGTGILLNLSDAPRNLSGTTPEQFL